MRLWYFFIVRSQFIKQKYITDHYRFKFLFYFLFLIYFRFCFPGSVRIHSVILYQREPVRHLSSTAYTHTRPLFNVISNINIITTMIIIDMRRNHDEDREFSQILKAYRDADRRHFWLSFRCQLFGIYHHKLSSVFEGEGNWPITIYIEFQLYNITYYYFPTYNSIILILVIY